MRFLTTLLSTHALAGIFAAPVGARRIIRLNRRHCMWNSPRLNSVAE